MKIAIMQPYFFPYIGYYQLVYSVDIFIFYDDVNYIKKGYIDRNSILVNNLPFQFKIPCNKTSSNKRINEIEIDLNQYSKWKNKFIKTLELAYRKAPFYSITMDLIDNILNKDIKLISEIAMESITSTFQYLGIEKKFKISSHEYGNRYLERADRLIDICKIEKIHNYINSPGGKELYQREYFKSKGINLYFIANTVPKYAQFQDEFVPNLSMIDILMFNSISNIRDQLKQFDIE
jgi:hypothetical protein